MMQLKNYKYELKLFIFVYSKKNMYDANYKMIKDSIFKDLTKVR